MDSSVDILSLTADTTGDMTLDYIPKNNGTGANKKILISKYKASDADILAGTSQAKFTDPKQVTDLVLNTGFVASANLKISADTTRAAVVSGTKAKVKEIKI